jgi:hypothetical protein
MRDISHRSEQQFLVNVFLLEADFQFYGFNNISRFRLKYVSKIKRLFNIAVFSQTYDFEGKILSHTYIHA